MNSKNYENKNGAPKRAIAAPPHRVDILLFWWKFPFLPSVKPFHQYVVVVSATWCTFWKPELWNGIYNFNYKNLRETYYKRLREQFMIWSLESLHSRGVKYFRNLFSKKYVNKFRKQNRIFLFWINKTVKISVHLLHIKPYK